MNQRNRIRFTFVNGLLGLILGKTTRPLASRLRDGSSEITDMARRIFDISSELSSSSTQQAAALQETSSSAVEVSAMVSQNADNASRSQEAAALSLQTAEKGRQTVARLAHSIEEISRSNAEVMKFFEDSNQRFAEIMKVITEVGDKTNVINDIVFQTKLLSFNAAVEAARAGEHGKGFAVVAEEVGNLAEMSGDASREISQLLSASIQRVEQIASETSARINQLSAGSQQTIERSAETARICGGVIEEVVTRVSDVKGLVEKIATASAEQSTGIHEINLAINQLNTVMQSNAVHTQEAANIAQQLRKKGSLMNQQAHSLADAFEARNSGPTGGGQVVPIRLVPKAEPRRQAEKADRLVVGGDVIPSRDDNRFEEV